MKYAITITPKPVVIVVDTISGSDVAEELARQRFLAKIKEDVLPIHDADHSRVEICEVPHGA